MGFYMKEHYQISRLEMGEYDRLECPDQEAYYKKIMDPLLICAHSFPLEQNSELMVPVLRWWHLVDMGEHMKEISYLPLPMHHLQAAFPLVATNMSTTTTTSSLCHWGQELICLPPPKQASLWHWGQEPNLSTTTKTSSLCHFTQLTPLCFKRHQPRNFVPEVQLVGHSLVHVPLHFVNECSLVFGSSLKFQQFHSITSFEWC